MRIFLTAFQIDSGVKGIAAPGPPTTDVIHLHGGDVAVGILYVGQPSAQRHVVIPSIRKIITGGIFTGTAVPISGMLVPVAIGVTDSDIIESLHYNRRFFK